MKFFTFTLSMVLFSIATFAQTTSCALYFRRNNGNGACEDGQLRLYYSTCPAVAPVIDSVYTNGAKSNVVFAAPDMSKCASQGFIGYCVIGGNMPPAALWTIFFNNTGGTDPFNCDIPQGGPLPIFLKTFGASRSGANVSIIWQTAYESNGQGFEIQRKSGNGFITVGTIAATNSLNGHAYSFIDKNSSTKLTEYRLRLLSKDAEAVYSEIKTVKGYGATVDFTVYPNPAFRNAKISVSDISEPTDVQVIDNIGRVAKTLTFTSSNVIELNNLQVGIYRVRLVNKSSGESVTKTLTVIQ